jgi:hypothetical protein
MSTVLAPNLVRTSPDMTADYPTADLMAEGSSRPLGYLYATWQPDAETAPEHTTDLGRYNPDTQTWDAPPGVITAGHWTWSSPAPWIHQSIDDACR